MSELLNLYKKIGNDGYGDAVAQIAPYFGTIEPQFVDLKPSYCEILIENKRPVHNHIGTMHAIALCNGAELVAGLTTDVSIPEGRRWIPIGMNVKYLAMAKTDIRVVCNGANIDWNVEGEVTVPVTAINASNEPVFTAEITMKISTP